VTGALLRRGSPRPYPRWLGRWPAALGLFGFAWIELASGFSDQPEKLAQAAVVYSLVTWAAMAVFGVEPWAQRGEAFGVYFNLFSRVSAFETRDRVLGVRPLLAGLPRLEPAPGTLAVVAVMIGTVTFDGFSQGTIWQQHLAVSLSDAFGSLGFGDTTATRLAATTGLLGGVGLVAGFYTLGVSGARLDFVHTLVPIAMVYAIAHYLSFLVFQGQAIVYLASDPLGDGRDLFGTARHGIDYGLLGQNAIWYLQVGFVILGHISGLVLAHDRALVLYGHAKQAVRSQYWMLGVMVGFTSLALWLLAQANR
jgi:hypothetical protein